MNPSEQPDTKLIGSSPQITQIRKSLPTIGRSRQNVLVTGGIGTEKTLIARMIESISNQESDCCFSFEASRLNAAFDYEMAEQIAGQTARGNAAGVMRGIMIVENVDHLTSDAQKQLTRIAQKAWRSTDERAQSVHLDLRLICTTFAEKNNDAPHWGLDIELFLLLSELIITVPSLKERRQDLPALIDVALNRVCQELNKPVPPVSYEIFSEMMKYEWPGNTKELENVIRSLVLSSPENELLLQALPFAVQREPLYRLELQNLGHAVAELERELIKRALSKFAGNQSRAALSLSISEPNLRFKMKKLGIHKNEFTYRP